MAFTGNIGHLGKIESPWGNAGGVVKTVEDVERMAHTGVGWIEAGSYTLEPRVGNSPGGERVYFHNPETGETFNSLGMPNKGMDVVEEEIPEMVRIAHAHKKPLIVNVAPVSKDPTKESLELVRRAHQAGADAVLLNAGCPNVVTADGGRKEILSLHPPNFAKVVFGIAELSVPFMVRISPQGSGAKMSEIVPILRNAQYVTALFTPNTWPDHRPVNDRGEEILQVEKGLGGKSGPAMEHEATKETSWAVEYSGRAIDVISSSSIVDAKGLKHRLTLGAVAGAGTTFFYEPKNGWREDVDRLLHDFAS